MSKEPPNNGYNTDRIIVLDTNVLSDILDASPNYYNFITQCLEKVRKDVFLTDTIRHELLRIQNKPYSPKVFDYVRGKVKETLEKDSRKELGNIKRLLKYKDNLQDASILEKAITVIEEKEKKLFSLLDSLSLANLIEPSLSVSNVYYVKEFISDIIVNGRISEPLDRVKLEQISYKVDQQHSKGHSFPDGNKKGISKYNDYFIVEEMKELSKKMSKDICFVTSDNKGNFQCDELGDEFRQETGQNIDVITESSSFYKSISDIFNISQDNIIELFIEDDKFEFIEEIRNSTEIERLVEEYLLNDIAGEDEEIESLDIDVYNIEVDSFNEDCVSYIIEIVIQAEKIYYDYWGRDEDTKEAVTSPPNYKSYDGAIKILVSRKFEVKSKKLITDNFQLDILDTNVDTETVTWGELDDS